MSCFVFPEIRSAIFPCLVKEMLLLYWCCYGPIWGMCWCPWETLRRFSSSGICFGWTWGIWKLFCVLAWAEACSGSQQSPLCPERRGRGGTGSQPALCTPARAPWMPLDIPNILGRGRGFLQLIHTQKCWDETPGFISSAGQEGHSIWPQTWERGGTGKGPSGCPIPGVQLWILPCTCQLGRLLQSPRQRNHSHPALAPLVMQNRF